MDGAIAAAGANSPLLKQLASSSSRTRAEALDNFRRYLSIHADLTALDYLKLWKGLFYSVWHSDRPKAQQSLARELASLVRVIPDEKSTDVWLRAFWETMAREWSGIPGLRMDKYLYLCRCYVAAGLEWCKMSGWDEGRIERHNTIMQQIPLSTEFEKREMTNGLRFHTLDVWIDELIGCYEEGSGMPVKLLMEPVRRLQRETKDKTVRARAAEAIADDRLKDLGEGIKPRYKNTSQNGDTTVPDMDQDDVQSEEDEWSGFEDG